LAEPRHNRLPRIAFLLMTALLALAAVELGLRYLDWPPAVTSGWRTMKLDGPLNQLGWRGQPWQPHRSSDFVVVLTGGAECAECPPDETLDLVLERALRRHNQNARVVTLSSQGYSQDQELLALHEYFTHERADLVVVWPSIAEDVPANTFHSVQTNKGRAVLKPTFALLENSIRGPSEMIGQEIYRFKLSNLLWPLFIDLDRNWTSLLPAPDYGAANAPADVATRVTAHDALEEQRSAWAVWLTPRPARVKYGIDLTRALFRQMRDLSVLHGARFTILMTPAETRDAGRVALEHAGRWFVADPATRDAAIAEVTDGFDTIKLPEDDTRPHSPDAERQTMRRLAEVLGQRNLLTSAATERPRH
jgi:hypothetical protein